MEKEQYYSNALPDLFSTFYVEKSKGNEESKKGMGGGLRILCTNLNRSFFTILHEKKDFCFSLDTTVSLLDALLNKKKRN